MVGVDGSSPFAPTKFGRKNKHLTETPGAFFFAVPKKVPNSGLPPWPSHRLAGRIARGLRKVEIVPDGAGTCCDDSGAREALRHVARLRCQGRPHTDRQRHDAFMRMPWQTSNDAQLDLPADR